MLFGQLTWSPRHGHLRRGCFASAARSATYHTRDRRRVDYRIFSKKYRMTCPIMHRHKTCHNHGRPGQPISITRVGPKVNSAKVKSEIRRN